jgi:hypothetical protein
MNRAGMAATLGVALFVGACGPSGRPDTASPATPVQRTGSADLLVLRDGDDSGATPYAIVDGQDGRVLSRLPAGVPASDWHVLYATRAAGASTVIRAIDPMRASIEHEISVTGDWQLPSVGIDRSPGGLSADGRTLVLEAATAGGSGTRTATRFAIVSTAGTSAPRVITVPGRLTFDALSPDGRFLYVLEHVTDLTYSVRQIDVVIGRLAEGTIVDKRNPDERMGGYAITQLSGTDGWVYTLYRGAGDAFIHALDTVHGGAFCIDLPGADGSDEATAGHWGLALDATRQVLYAANGALGIVDEVSLDGFAVSRMKRFAAAAPVATLTKFGIGEATGGGRQVAASADGSMLYVVGQRAVVSVERQDLRPVGRLGDDRRYRGLALSPAGALYVIDEAGTVSRVDPSDGHIGAVLDRHAFAAIVAVLAAP